MTADGPMDCSALVELVTAYLEGTLDSPTRATVDTHLLECPGCANYLQQLGATMSTLRRMSDDDLDPAFRQRLMAVFKSTQ